MKTCCFLGKFQPPHLGHILTINKLLKKYQEIVIGITESAPNLFTYKMRKSILNEGLNTNRVKYVKIKGSIEQNTANLELIDKKWIIASGNQKVINKCKFMGYKTHFVARSKDSLYNSTIIREANKSLNKELATTRIENRKIEELRPIEKVFQSHFELLYKLIIKDKVVKQPIIVDEDSGAVLDGSHRFAVLYHLGAKYCPCHLVSYKKDNIFVGDKLSDRWSERPDSILTKQKILNIAYENNLLDPRSTRHFFPFRKIENPTNLRSLCLGEKRNVNHLISSKSKKYQLLHEVRYIKEIEDETLILLDYLKEQQSVRQYLQGQIDNLIQNNIK